MILYEKLEGEIDIEIKGFEHYRITNFGRVINKHNKVLKPFKNKYYYQVNLKTKGKKDNKFLVHRLVAINFLPNDNNLTIVNHIDGIKTNNRLDNLEWCNPSYNSKHAFETGLSFKMYKMLHNNDSTFDELRKLLDDGYTIKYFTYKKSGS